MTTVSTLLDALARAGRTFVTSVPDKGLAPLIDAVDSDRRFVHVACTREEEAIGLCAGAAFAGVRGVLLMQNSGLGNSVNALTSLVRFYDLPLLMLISRRGGQGERIAAQLPMGRATDAILAACEVVRVDYPGPEATIAQLSDDADACVALVATPDEWARLIS
jgi:sulfopyruvate decarboxylase subunit alpha